MRRDFTLRDAAGADRLLDLARPAPLATACPVRKAGPQPRIRDVSVAVVRVLREDGQDQLVERRVVRLVAGPSVKRAQPVTD